MRNILFIHLESLSNYIYRLHPELFPNLREYEAKSLSFSKYFSTATSTLMVVADILYGQLQQYEGCKSLVDVLDDYPSRQSWLDEMKAKGYNAQALICHCGDDQIEAEKRHMVGFDVQMTIRQNHKEHLDDIRQVIENDTPFALIVCNHTANIAYQKLIPDAWADSGLDRWSKGYQFMDNYVKDIVDMVEQNGKLKDTTIIFYGDHGDEIFSHGLHMGLTHAFEPFADIIHTPMWICDSRLDEVKMIDNLVDATDLRDLANALLAYPEPNLKWDKLNIKKREYTVARGAYAAQPVREDSFNKGYSITDGNFIMIVTSKGLELYDIRMDEGCHNNLLRFFRYDNGILSLDTELNQTLKYHYRALFNMNTIRQIRQNFYYYRNLLREEVGKLYRSVNCEENMREMNFEEIHYI